MDRAKLSRPFGFGFGRAPVARRTLLVVFGLASLAGNYFSLPLFYGVDFLFGSIAALLAAALFGPWAGAAVAAFGALYTWFLWDHPYAIVIFTLEAWLIGYALRRYPEHDLTLLAAGFWLVVGMPLAWLVYTAFIGTDPQATLLVVLKQAVNGVFNALVAVLLLRYSPLGRRLLGGGAARDDKVTLPLRAGLFHLTSALVLLGVVSMTALEGRGEYRHIGSEVAERLERAAHRSTLLVGSWLAERQSALAVLAQRAAELDMAPGAALDEATRVLSRGEPNLVWVTVVDPQGRVIAGEGVRPWVGNQLPDIRLLRQAAAEAGAAGEPVMGEGPEALRVAVPVRDGERLLGLVVGDVAVEGMAALLDADAAAGALRITLQDAHGAPLLSSTGLTGEAPELVQFGVDASGVSHWVPAEALHLPPLERWRQAVYVAHAPLPPGVAVPGAMRLELPAAPYRARLYEGYITTLVAGITVLLLGLLVAHLASRRVVTPIRQLAGMTADLPDTMRGGTPAPWPRSRFTEVVELTRNFQGMMAVLQRQFRELEQVKEALERRAGELAAAQGKLSGILNSVEDVVWSAHIDAAGRLRVDYVSPALQRFYGYDPQLFVGRTDLWAELAHPDGRLRVAEALHELAAARVDEMDLEYGMRTREGGERRVRNRAWLTRDGAGGAWRIDGILSDVTEWREVQDQLRLSAKVFENTAEAIMIAGPDHRIVSVNRAFEEITGYAAQEVIGRRPHGLFAPRHGAGFFTEILEAVRDGGQWRGEAWGRRRDEQEYPKWLSVTTVDVEAGSEGRHFIALFSDISERRAREEHIRQLAHYDFLTGLPNRALFQELLSQALLAAQRRHRRVAVLFLDLDRFKNVNDTLGHLIGDELLCEVARRLRACVRAADVVCRQGGDEFVVLLADVEGPAAVTQVAEKVLHAVAQPFHLRGHELSVTPSVGIALYPDDGHDHETLMKHADVAMYHAKSQGRNNFQFFAPALNAATGERLRLESSLRLALQRDELRLRYQPQIDAASGRVVAVEALVSWQHPRKGLLAPERFVPLAEETGLIVPLGEWVLQEACRQARDWQEAGAKDVCIAVNLSPVQFRHGELPAMVRDALEESGLDPACLELELTENIIMPGDRVVGDVLKSLKDMGVSLAVDDFGTGYSNLSYLKRFPLDKLKIDRSFVSDMIEDEGDAAIVSAIIGLAKKLNYRVLAEGVETAAQYAHLRREGCDQIQGYYVCRPVQGERIMQVLGGAEARVH